MARPGTRFTGEWGYDLPRWDDVAHLQSRRDFLERNRLNFWTVRLLRGVYESASNRLRQSKVNLGATPTVRNAKL